MPAQPESLKGRCPNCGSNNIQAEPLYPYEEDEDYFSGRAGGDEAAGDLAVFCVSCGHYMGEMASQLTARMQTLRRRALNLFDDAGQV